ncbi:hypothetical protein LY78DRAFT_218672 [Colletotrichum sublineola]|nr:hypothetical protein LY78DRAFT_218672 [Colletotrichum sublineola]
MCSQDDATNRPLATLLPTAPPGQCSSRFSDRPFKRPDREQFAMRRRRRRRQAANQKSDRLAHTRTKQLPCITPSRWLGDVLTAAGGLFPLSLERKEPPPRR